MHLSVFLPLLAQSAERGAAKMREGLAKLGGAFQNATSAPDAPMSEQWGSMGDGGGLYLLLPVLLIVLLARGGGKSSSKASSGGGSGGKLLPIGLLAVAAMVFLNGGIG